MGKWSQNNSLLIDNSFGSVFNGSNGPRIIVCSRLGLVVYRKIVPSGNCLAISMPFWGNRLVILYGEMVPQMAIACKKRVRKWWFWLALCVCVFVNSLGAWLILDTSFLGVLRGNCFRGSCGCMFGKKMVFFLSPICLDVF